MGDDVGWGGAAVWLDEPSDTTKYTYVEGESNAAWFKPRLEEDSGHRAAADFPVGTRVRLTTRFQDFMPFRGNETGTVVRNGDRYLSIIVRFDEPIHVGHPGQKVPDGFETWGEHRRRAWLEMNTHRLEEFGFQPSDLALEGEQRGDDT